jgi:hypothetical protein
MNKHFLNNWLKDSSGALREHTLSLRKIRGTHICQRLSTLGPNCCWNFLHKLKNPNALPGTEPATFRLVAH